MRIKSEWMIHQGGVVSTRTLRRWGNSPHDIAKAVRTGELHRLRAGWFAIASADPEVVRAVAAGGALGCMSVLRRQGVWTVDTALHVRVAESDGRNLPQDVKRCTLPGGRLVPSRPIDDLPTALVAASRCCSDEELLIVLDSVVNLRLMERDEVERLLGGAPLAVRRVVREMDLAESGTETMVRHRLRARGVELRPQVVIEGVGRVDFVVGTSLVIEVDSVEHHTSREAYERDRERDRLLQSLGYTVVRLTYRQVRWDWPRAEADILALMRRRRHRQRVARAVSSRESA